MAFEEAHHRIRVGDLKQQLAKLPDDALVTFITGDTRCQFLGIAPSDIPGVEGVFVVQLRPLQYPPIAR